MLKIDICVCTFRRPQMLAKLLESLINLEQTRDFTTSIIVVDNDCHQSARPIVENFQYNPKTSIQYYNEPRQNIALARNAAVNHAVGDFVAFIDDDEVASPNWVKELVNTLKEYRADGVLGPVIGYFVEEIPVWIRKGKFCNQRTELVSGTELRFNQTATNNCIISREALQSIPGPFDPVYGLSGGEDTDMFKRLIERGYHFFFSAEARVFEYIPPHRTSASFLLRRAFGGGLIYTNQVNVLSLSIIKKGQFFLKAMALTVFYLMMVPFTATMGFYRIFSCLQGIAIQVGKFASLLKFQSFEYRRSDQGEIRNNKAPDNSGSVICGGPEF